MTDTTTSDADLEQFVASYDHQAAELQTLQGRRVRNILLVASLYDAYTLSEGQHLSELIIGTYQDLALSAPPRIVRVSTRAQALAALADEAFDLVFAIANVAD